MFNVNKIEEIRKERKFTQQQICIELGISPKTYTNHVSNSEFSAKELYLLSKIFNVEVGCFFDENAVNLQEPQVKYELKSKTNEELRNEILDLNGRLKESRDQVEYFRKLYEENLKTK